MALWKTLSFKKVTSHENAVLSCSSQKPPNISFQNVKWSVRKLYLLSDLSYAGEMDLGGD